MATPSLAMIPSGYKDGKVYSVLPSNGDGDFTFSRGSSATRVNKDGLIETITDQDTPRLDYTDSSCPSLLLEPQSTNLIEYSEDFSDSNWTKSSSGLGTAPILTSNYGISPDGTQNASRLQMNLNGGTTGSDISFLSYFISSTSSASNSVYIKSLGGNTTMTFRCGSTFKIVTVTNEWQRFDESDASGTDRFQLLLYGNTDSQSADLLIYGAQIEEQSYATSYIPTNGAIATRLADECNSAGTSDTFNDSEGVLYAEIASLSDDLTNRGITISDGSVSNRVTMFYTSVSNAVQVKVVVGGSNSLNSYITIPDISLYNKIALRYKQDDFSLFVNGFELITGTSGNTFSDGTLTELAFDRGDGAEDFYGNVKDVRVYNTALTDAELEELTTL